MTKNKRRSIARASAVLALLVWVGASVVVWRSPVEGAPQKAKRILRGLYPGGGVPVTITRVTVEGAGVEFKHEFEAKDDWFKSTVVTVENRSQKPVAYVQIDMRCPRQDDKPMYVFEMRYGSSKEDPIAAGQDRPAIGPGESVEIRLSENNQARIAESLHEEGYDHLSLVEIVIHDVIWSDGTRWHGGRIWKKGADGKWAPEAIIQL